MDGVRSDLSRVGEWIETLLWSATWLGILVGWLLESGDRLLAVWAAPRRPPQTQEADARRVGTQIVGFLLAAILVAPSLAGAQGWWSGSPANPGFEPNTVIQVTGTASQVNLVSRGGPAMLRLDVSGEAYLVMLGPGWYLEALHPDIREGDPLAVEGSKMMDRRGNLHLVAARVTNRRTGSVLELRDETGRPQWMGGRPWGNGR